MVRVGPWFVRGVIACAGLVALGCSGGGLGRGPAANGGGLGSGGAPGAGGVPGAGGGTPAGGAPGTGGAPDPGAGGATGTGAGGTTGAGGVVGTGGMTGAGGDPSCRTSVSGTVYDPSGSVPLPNVLVYVPSSPPSAMTDGLSCPLCQNFVPQPAFARTQSDASGQFKLDGVPPGSNVSLVVETGKWRRQTVIPKVAACANTTLTDPELTRLPRNQSEGHLPRIAVATGRSSPIECLLRSVGIADTEFTNDAGNGRVHVYVGGAGDPALAGTTQLVAGPVFSDAYTKLFADPTRLALYDFVVLACEGSALTLQKSPYVANMRGYADHGGRLFLEHLGSSWISRGLPPWPSTAAWSASVLPNPPSPLAGNLTVDFPRGVMLSMWLESVGASTNGQLSITTPEHSVNGPAAEGVQVWLTTPATPPATVDPVLQLSFGTPLEADPPQRCGRVDFSDMHVAAGAGSVLANAPFPSECSTLPPSAQQRMWEFMFFDNALCVIPDGH